MSLSVYDIIYIICNLFNVYIVAKLMRAVFNNKIINTKIEFCSYILQFLIVSIIYLFIDIPVVLLVLNILVLFMISFNYKATIRIRLFYTFIIYLLFMFIEVIVVLISGFTFNSMYTKSNYQSIWGVICIKIISFIVANILEKQKSKRKGGDIPFIYWICICLIPFISLYMIYILFQKNDISNFNLIISIFLLLFENLVIFNLYDVIVYNLENKAQQKLLEQQNKFYLQQLKLMETALNSTKEIRHDLKNHLSSLHTLAIEDENNSISEYLENMLNTLCSPQSICNSGNIIIDSIINFKYVEAHKENINFITDIIIPSSLNIDDFDITVILGNLLDNAIQAVEKLDDKEICLSIKYDKGRLLIKISNKFLGNLIYNNGDLISTKNNKDSHGIGIKNVKQVLDKYRGEMNIFTKDNIFTINIIIYL